jgi:hypothetical protein
MFWGKLNLSSRFDGKHYNGHVIRALFTHIIEAGWDFIIPQVQTSEFDVPVRQELEN